MLSVPGFHRLVVDKNKSHLCGNYTLGLNFIAESLGSKDDNLCS